MKDDKAVPSVTWIASYYPKGTHFYKWLASKGWNEAEAIKQAAGDKGSKVHKAVEDLLNGKEVKMEDKYRNPTTEEDEELSLEEYEAIMTFASWFKEIKPKTISTEFIVWNDEENYAGTVDYLCEIDGVKWLIDFKTSNYIWPEHQLQISAYKHALGQDVKLGILQLGYPRNKKGFKFTEIPDKYNLFLSAKEIWQEEAGKQQPKVRDYPTSLKLIS